MGVPQRKRLGHTCVNNNCSCPSNSEIQGEMNTQKRGFKPFITTRNARESEERAERENKIQVKHYVSLREQLDLSNISNEAGTKVYVKEYKLTFSNKIK